MSVRTRFAPSPTGVLHIGSVRTALFCWLYARRHGGQFVLRIEDTDRERSTEANVDAILDGLRWLGLDCDEGPIFQTERFERYKEIVTDWLQDGRAYRCYCTKEELAERRERQIAEGLNTRYDGRCRDRPDSREGVEPVVRFRNPENGSVEVNDVVRGNVIFQNSELDDLIIARSDGTPTYNFTVVVDDSDMKITHVIRGDDHLNNTPRQINMLAAMDVQPPVYAHLPMILGTDGAKLSKRHGAIDVREYREQGYLPEAVLNYLVRLGWSHGDQEIFSVDEMIDLFDITAVNQSASAFNPEKLRWINQQYIIAAPVDRIADDLVPFLERAGYNLADGPDPAHVAGGFRERAETLLDMATSCRYCYEDFEFIDPKSVKKHLRPVILEPLRAARENLDNLDDWSRQKISQIVEQTAAEFEINMGKLGQPIRVAVTGGSVSPPIDVTLELVGQKKTIARLDRGIELIEKRASGGE